MFPSLIPQRGSGLHCALLACSVGLPCLPAVANSPTPESVPDLPAVTVVGRGMSGAYQSQQAEGSKSTLPLRELPQSVRVITRQALDDLGAVRLDDVLDYVGGVSRQNSFGGLWDNIAIRGLPGNENTGMAMLLNGMAANRGFNAQRDMAAVDRVEFLKGPASALYGSSEPGGTLNIINKRPLWRAAHAIDTSLGTDEAYRVALDTTGPLGEHLAYRLNVALEDKGSFRDKVDTRREVVAPALTWKLQPSTWLDYHGEWLFHRAPLDRGVVAVDDRLGGVDRSTFLGEPADGDMSLRNASHQWVLNHEWSPDWRGKFALSWRETALKGFSTEASALQADDRTLRRQRRHRDYDSQDLALQAELQGHIRWLDLQHEVVAGLETFRYRMDQVMLRVNPSAGAPYAIDVLDPVYGQPQPTPALNTSTDERQRNLAVYVQDTIHLAPQWRLVAGLRTDHFDQSLLNRRTGMRTEQTPRATSPRLGLSWLPTPEWTVYASASRSFRPNGGVDAKSRPFDPEQGRALELGAKWERSDRRLGGTVAVFDIRKRNVLTADPDNSNFQRAAGEVSSRGLELDVAGQLTPHWRLNASLVYNDVSIERDNTLVEGEPLLNVPRVNGSVLAVYEATLANGQRLGIGGGLTHVGERLGQAYSRADVANGIGRFHLPGYTTAKLVGYWQLDRTWRMSLDIDNLFDETFYTQSYSRVWVSPGTPRQITLGIQSRF